MALTDDDVRAVEQGGFCPSCGEAVGTGRFCSSCGEAIPTRMGAASNYSLSGNSTGPGANGSLTGAGLGGSAIPPSTAGPRAAPPGAPGRSSRTVLIALGVLGLVAVAVAAVILTTRGSSNPPAKRSRAHAASTPSTSAVYHSKLRTELAPLVSANHRMSAALTAVQNARTTGSAKNAASAAQTATATAKGAVGALTVPRSQRTLSQEVQQALTNENGYVQAVVATLGNPGSSQAGQLQTLATSLQSSLVPLGSVVHGAAASVSGASTLINWANQAASRAGQNGSTQSSSPASTTPAAAASSGGSSTPSTPTGQPCGNGLYAGPNTSCPFAENVRQAYDEAPGDAATVQVYSPVTGLTYSMSCSPAGEGVTCSGGNDASVSW